MHNWKRGAFLTIVGTRARRSVGSKVEKEKKMQRKITKKSALHEGFVADVPDSRHESPHTVGRRHGDVTHGGQYRVRCTFNSIGTHGNVLFGVDVQNTQKEKETGVEGNGRGSQRKGGGGTMFRKAKLQHMKTFQEIEIEGMSPAGKPKVLGAIISRVTLQKREQRGKQPKSGKQ